MSAAQLIAELSRVAEHHEYVCIQEILVLRKSSVRPYVRNFTPVRLSRDEISLIFHPGSFEPG